MSVQAPRDELTTLLGRWRTGTPEDRERLFAAVHGELRRTARAYKRRERRDHTLQPTALAHEAYLRLIRDQNVCWEDRAHFFGIAARVMRQILVDHARKRGADQTQDDPGRPARFQIADPFGGQDHGVLALHEALDQMAGLDPRQAEIVELRYFGGLTEEEVATIMRLSPVTIRREVAAAMLWLGRGMKGQR
jgi:RNA polymerase sigma-70 factor (ECF subfamily)